MKALVTGSTGFIGKPLCRELLKKGFDLLTTSTSASSITGHVICDLEKETLGSTIFKEIDYVFHCAGFAHDVSNQANLYEKYMNLNVKATKQICQVAGKSNVKSFVYISSVKAGDSEINTQKNNENVYGATKRKAEEFLMNYEPENNMRINIIRPALVYGPDMKGNLKNMLNGIKKGWFPPLPKIYNKRSMIHIDDLISAIMIVNEKEDSDKEIYIATDGNSYSTSDIYDVLLELSGKTKPAYNFPPFLFKLLGFISTNMNHKIKKLFNDEVYDPSKLFSIGFSPKKSLKDLYIRS